MEKQKILIFVLSLLIQKKSTIKKKNLFVVNLIVYAEKLFDLRFFLFNYKPEWFNHSRFE